MIIDGKKIAEGLREKLKKKIKEFKSNLKIAPGLSVILVGEDPTSPQQVHLLQTVIFLTSYLYPII